jgi:hypothetical protein
MLGTLFENEGKTKRANPGDSFLSCPSKNSNRGSAIAVATRGAICDEPIYGLDNCFDLLPVCPVIVRPRGFDVLEVVAARIVKSD